MNLTPDTKLPGDLNAAILICSRLGSSRVYQKAIEPIDGGKGPPLIRALAMRCSVLSGLPTWVVVPRDEEDSYAMALGGEFLYRLRPNHTDAVYALSPLHRMAQAAGELGLTHVVRVTHDKLWVDARLITETLKKNSDFDYVFMTGLIAGTGFEIISRRLLEEASLDSVKPVEHVSHACLRVIAERSPGTYKVKAETSTGGWICGNFTEQRPSLLIDTKRDLQFMQSLARVLGNDWSAYQSDVFRAVRKFSHDHFPPTVSVYTCIGPRATKDMIATCRESVDRQRGSVALEWMVFDDTACDMSSSLSLFDGAEHVLKAHPPPVSGSIGVASASNCCVGLALGEFVVRMDVDDYFLDKNAVARMVEFARIHGVDIVYPSFICEDHRQVRSTRSDRHAGGVLYRAKALQALRFTDGLSAYDGADLQLRADRVGLVAKDMAEPTFFYSSTPGSLSRVKTMERERVAKLIEVGKCGRDLVGE